MPKLPDVTGLGQRPTAQPNLGVTGYDETLTAPGRAMQRLGEAVGQAGQNFEKIYKEEERKNSIARIEDAHNKLKLKALDLKSGKNGYSNIRGEGVDDNFIPKYQEELESFSGEVSQGFSPQEKQAFKQVTDSVKYSLTAGMVDHSVREKEVYKNKVFKDVIGLAHQGVSNNFATDNLVLSEIERAAGAVREKGKHDGFSDEIIKSEVNKVKGALFKTAIDAALDAGDPIRAKALLNARFVEDGNVTVVSEIIDPDKRGHLQDVINKKDIQYEAEREVEKKILETADEKELLDWARSFSGEKQDAVRKRLYDYLQDVRVSKNLDERHAEDTANSLMYKGIKVDDLPQSVLDNLSPKKRVQLKEFENRKAAAAASRKAIHTEWKDYHELRAMHTDDPSRFQKLANDPNGPFPGKSLANTEMRILLNLSTGDKDLTNAPAIQKEIDLAITDIFKIKDVASERKKTGNKADKIHAFDAKIDSLIDEFYRKDKRYPNNEETRGIIKREQIRMIKKGLFGESEVSAASMEVPGVPPKAVVDLANIIFNRKGKPATAEEIEELYKRHQGSLGK